MADKNDTKPTVKQQLELFETALPRKPYCTDDLATGLQIRGRATALRRRYLQVNPPHLRAFVIFDVDRPGAALSWDDAMLPMPFWTSMSPENGHAHLAYALSAPVLVADNARDKPLRYLAAVEQAMRAKLDADPAYSGLITKNPMHRHWRTLWAPEGAGVYELGYLSEYLDLPKHIDRRRKPEEAGLGRNVTIFDWLRHLAYREIRGWKQATVRGVFVQWQTRLYHAALQRNGDFPVPLDHREVHHIAKSVARWVWSRFDIEASDRRFSERQRARGRRAINQAEAGTASGASRRAKNEDKRASARLMRAQGMTQREIAASLKVNQSTVARWLL